MAYPPTFSSRAPTAACVACLISLAVNGCDGGSATDPEPGPDLAIVDRVVVTPDSGSVSVGGTFRFEGEPLNTAGRRLTTALDWSTTDPGIALVDPTGLVTGVAPGATLVVAAAGAEADTSALTVTSTAADRFDLSLTLPDGIPVALETALEAARSRWEALIVGDLPDVTGPVDACDDFHPADSAGVDDVALYVRVEELDGPYGVLGLAAPCILRTDGLPLTAIMVIDSGDLPLLTNLDQLDQLILHEMGHALGIGSLWDEIGLRASTCADDPYFTGAGAVAAFDAAGGSGYGGPKVPIQRGACTHWRESVLQHELMTPVLQGDQDNPLSAITVRSLQDLGYEVDVAHADRYSITSATPAAPTEQGRGLALGHDILPVRQRTHGR